MTDNLGEHIVRPVRQPIFFKDYTGEMLADPLLSDVVLRWLHDEGYFPGDEDYMKIRKSFDQCGPGEPLAEGGSLPPVPPAQAKHVTFLADVLFQTLGSIFAGFRNYYDSFRRLEAEQTGGRGTAKNRPRQRDWQVQESMGRLEQQAYQGLDGKRYFLINEMTHAMNLEAGLDISPMQLRGWVKRGQIKAPRRGEVDGKRYSQRSDWRLFEATRENVVQATLAVSQLRERKPHVPKNHVRRKVLAMALGITPNALIYYEDLGMLTPIRTAAGICYSSEEVRALKEYRNGFRDQR